MSLDFFKNEKSVKPVKEFGIVDPASCDPAYVDYVNQSSWDTKVNSNNRTDVMFNAIDNNIVFYKSWRRDLEKQRICDAMLYTNDTIVFLEIKNWHENHGNITFIESAAEQLENTIVHFCTAHPERRFSKKYAYISNKTGTSSRMSRTQEFSDNTNGFILQVATKIDL